MKCDVNDSATADDDGYIDSKTCYYPTTTTQIATTTTDRLSEEEMLSIRRTAIQLD